MTENDIMLFLVLLCITIIPLCLYITIVISKEIDGVIKRCGRIGKWAKKELDRRAKDERFNQQTGGD